jgi:hypothetical protein
MLHRVDLVRTDVSEELSASFIRVTRIGELGTVLAVTSNRNMLRSELRLLVTANAFPSWPILVTLMLKAMFLLLLLLLLLLHLAPTALGEPWSPSKPVSPRLVVRFLNNILFTG